MRYPEFIKANELIGISAPSAGVGKKLEAFNRSIKRLNERYQTLETASVRVNNIRSADAYTRAKEFNSLFLNDEVKLVMSAAGGDFLYEILPYIDFELIKLKPKWVVGASDPTSILYTLTTKYDIATLYGVGAGSFDVEHKFLDIALEYLGGNLLRQESYDKCQSLDDFLNDNNTYSNDVLWVSSIGDLDIKGRLIGGCLEVIKDLMGTIYDGTKAFIKRYYDDGIVWYLDNFSMSAENMYRTLLQMRYAGYFENTKLIILGRVCFESSETGMTYEEALKMALNDIPYIYGADVGHVSPKMIMINGAIIDVKMFGNKAKIDFELK